MGSVTGKDAHWAMEVLGPGSLGLVAPADADVRQVPGAEFDANLGVWVMPLSWSTCVAVRAVLGPYFTLGPKVQRWIADEFDRRIRPATQALQIAAPKRGTPVLDDPCSACGLPREWWPRGPVRGVRRDRIYCSSACKQRAWRAKTPALGQSVTAHAAS